MKTNRMTEIIGAIDENLIAEAAQSTRKPRRRLQYVVGAAAACLCLIAGGVAWKTGLFRAKPQKPVTDTEFSVDEDMDMVLELFEGEFAGRTMRYQKVSVRAAVREKIIEGELSDNLGESVGRTSDSDEWFRVKKREDLQYLIRSTENEGYSLWKFRYTDDYTYALVFPLVYNIHSAEDIREIVARPSLRDNTTAGKKMQEEVGVHCFTDRAVIARFYEILTDEAMQTTGSPRFDAGPESVRAERYFDIVTADGRVLDFVKYDGVTGGFFEFGGITFVPSAAEDQAWLAQLLSIAYNPDLLLPTATPTPQP
ncbi:MAG: hypothetical protein K6B39_05715 [Lachnospiraceae bacterium]|nr:hypothetical protein [Lachnospiraceae bacterium]